MLSIHTLVHKALGSCSGWAKWGNKSFLGCGWWFYIFLRFCWTLLSPPSFPCYPGCQGLPTTLQAEQYMAALFSQLLMEISSGWRMKAMQLVFHEKKKQKSLPQVHHPVDWQWQTFRRSNHWYKCIPETHLTRWTFLLGSLSTSPLPKRECFQKEQNPKEIRDPFLPMHLLLKHTSERDLFQLRSSVQGRTLSGRFALHVGLKNLLTAFMALHSLRKLIPKHSSSWSVDRTFLSFPIEMCTYVLLLGVCTKPCIVGCTGY